ncbi:glycosyltransferase 87 family protein [Terrabacter terrigena]|uniref:Glycosyltransferase 87 family protein n=1 Tax=Terrabacter terrigena TaxID=574718 RepID=A0ABW3MYE1_9MICO
MRWSRLLNGPAPVAVLVAVAAVAGGLHGGFTDLHVYQQTGRAVLDGMPSTPPRDPVTALTFTYPPFAGLVMVPLALLPAWVAAAVWTGASTAALAAVVVLVRRTTTRRSTPGWLAAAVCAGALAMEPVWQNVAFGQVNVLVMAVVLLDLLRPDRRWSGVPLGLVAGVKLTPLVFVVLLVVVGRRETARRALLAFGATVAVGFLAAPGWATSYWTDGLVDAGRIGPPALAHNQSVYGALTRLLDGRPSTVLWLAVAVPLGAAILLVARGWWHRGDRPLATGLAALAGLVASPISWSHHWVWAVPVALVLWERARWAAVAWAAVFVGRPMLWLPWGQGREYSWTPLEHVLGNAYLLAALAVPVWAAVSLTSRAGLAERAEPVGRSPQQGVGY